MKRIYARYSLVIAMLPIAACTDTTVPLQPRSSAPPSVGRDVTVGANGDIQAAIDAAGPGETIILSQGDYYLSSPSLRIENKSGLTIRGNGQGSTILHPTDTAFAVESNVNNLTIQDLTIQGPTSASGATYGIGMTGGTTNTYALTFQRLEVREVNVGISVAGDGPAHGCDNVTIYGNTLIGIRSRFNASTNSTSGSGYGIHNQRCTHVRIAENYIEEAERHSIYQSVGDGPTEIEDNFILNHMVTGTIQQDQRLVALNITNSSNVRVGFNTIVNSNADAISVEYEPDGRGGDTQNVQLIGNSVVGDHYTDLFITAHTTIQVWGNKYYHRGTTGSTDTPAVQVDGDAYYQGYTLEGPTVRWWGTQYVVARTPNDTVFVVQNNAFHHVIKAYGTPPDSWNYAPPYYDGGFSGIQAAVADYNTVYAMISGTLYALTPGSSWSVRTSPSNWFSFDAMAISNGQLYIVQNGYLHHVDPSTFSYSSPSPQGGWDGTQALVGYYGRLFAMRNDCTYDISTSTLTTARSWC